MSISATERAVAQLKKYPQSHSEKWEYIRDLKKMMKEMDTTKDPEEFTRKWFIKGLI